MEFFPEFQFMVSLSLSWFSGLLGLVLPRIQKSVSPLFAE